VLQLLDEKAGIEQVMMTEIHAYTSDQHILDHAHRDLRRARAGAQNLIPTSSSSISAVQQVLPNLAGKIAGYSMRVPVNNVAVLDLTVNLTKAFDKDTINSWFEQYTNKKIIAYSTLPLVSSDFNHRYESAIFDATQTQVLGKTIKLLVWYDNEWGYVNRILDLLRGMRNL
jgi:glyceraldehyde 3-phosphate dehydrogenase